MDIRVISEQQLRDYDEKQIGSAFATLRCSTAEAYEIQAAVSRLREQRGEAVVGYKVGCVSAPLRESMGIHHPVLGRLFDTEQWPSGTHLHVSDFVQPAIEGELAVRLGQSITRNNLSEKSLTAAIDEVFAVIEMHNKVFRAKPAAPELIANNALHAGVVYAVTHSSGLPDVPGPLTVVVNDVEVACVAGSNLRDTVISSLYWLVQELDKQGAQLCAGQTVLCGTIAGMHGVDAEDTVRVVTADFGSVCMRLT
jgi:2-keto-4-pentenoate hydratase